MKFAFKFSNLLGTVYRKGDLIFTPDGNSVISPVGNRITIYDLKNNKSNTLPIESDYNLTALDLSPNGCTLIAVNEEGEAYLISMISCTVIHRYKFFKTVRAVKFSPDGKHFAVCKESNVFIMKSPGPYTGEYNAFVMERVFKGAIDDTTCIEWSSCSRLLAVGSKDMCVRIYALEQFKNLRSYLLGGHSHSIVGCFFEKNSYDITTVSQNGQVCIWECTLEEDGMIVGPPQKRKKTEPKPELSDDAEDDLKLEEIIEKIENNKQVDFHIFYIDNVDDDVPKFGYKKISKHYLGDEVRKQNSSAYLTTAAYHKDTKILVIGFSTGVFFLYELPDVNLIHSLSISEHQVSSIAISKPGDWIALGCSGIGQLLVWEWQSEQYVLKQQGHSSDMTCLCYSPDGQYIATGGQDGKVKLWNTATGFCFVTFSEHTSSITDIQFSANKKFFISSSLDGTIRCFDINRYRNFRTLTSPTPVQFSCCALDSSGELCAAGGQDVFEIYVWSIKLGKLLEILGGHEGPVVSLAFSPVLTSSALASVSWDKTLRLWNCIEEGSDHETIQLNADGLQVVYRPDGQEVAVCTLSGQICVFNVRTSDQMCTIDGRNDLGSGRSDTDLITSKKNLRAKAFTSLCYSADGQCLLAGGQSKNICIYSIKESILLKKFEITLNKSLDSMSDFINRRHLTEFGNLLLVEKRTELEGGDVALRLPGVRKGDMADRNLKPEIRVFCVRFSPTGQSFSVATTEGLMQYSLNSGGVFQPFELELSATPQSVREALAKQEWSSALISALRLNEPKIVQEAIERVPLKDISLTIANLPDDYLRRVLKTISDLVEGSCHIEFYLHWISSAFTTHGSRAQGMFPMPTLLALEKGLSRKYQQLSDICDFNKYTIRYIKDLGRKHDEQANAMEVDDELKSEADSSGRGTGESEIDSDADSMA
ncbi:periodic tryptophan protein 2 homolog isoform X2 [Arctopsyche grandis]|uniref:periodic tryptophan protein 2 homolog isoform X2 n=1 Tax=Arctopsyche grandis TaxID=121162 RepID=UPI00406D9E64